MRLARGVFWSMAGAVISRFLVLIAMVLVARSLGKTTYGELGMIRSTVGMFGVFAGFAAGLTATKHVAEFRQSDPDRAGRILGLSGLVAMGTGGMMALALFVIAPWLAEHSINAPQLGGVLRISALILLFNALNGAQTGALSGFEAFKTIAYINVASALISFAVLVGGAYLAGLSGVVWGLAVGLGINWLLNHVALRREAARNKVPFTFRGCGREWRILWRFSLPAVLAGSMVGPVMWVCAALLVNQPDGYEEMGLYSAADQWFALVMFLPLVLGTVVLPVLSEQLGRRDSEQAKKTMVIAVKLNLIIVAPIVVAASFASPHIMRLYGDSFSSGWLTLVLLLATAGLLAVLTPIGQMIAATGKMWIGFLMNGGWAVVLILSTVALLDFGSAGLAGARLISYSVHATWTLGFAFWFLRRGRIG